MFALLLNNVVIQLSETPFPVADGLEWVEIPKDVTIENQYSYDGEKFNPPDAPGEIAIDTRVELLNAIAQYNLGQIDKTQLQATYDNFSTSGVMKTPPVRELK